MDTREKTNIFIVEDNAIFRETLKIDIETSFKNHNIVVHAFETGEACLKSLSKTKPEVFILDYHLNGKITNASNGIEILDEIKKEKYDTNVIILTNEDNLDIAVKAFK